MRSGTGTGLVVPTVLPYARIRVSVVSTYTTVQREVPGVPVLLVVPTYVHPGIKVQRWYTMQAVKCTTVYFICKRTYA